MQINKFVTALKTSGIQYKYGHSVFLFFVPPKIYAPLFFKFYLQFQCISQIFHSFFATAFLYNFKLAVLSVSMTEQFVYQHHQYVVIGAGISGLQTGIILAENNKDFVVLQASNKIGGRIGTQKLGDVLKQEYVNESDYPKWISCNKQVLETPIQYGATWISNQHEFVLKMLKEFKIRVFPQYYDGLAIYGKQPGKYEEVRSVNQHYKAFQQEIQKLLDKIDSIKKQLKEIRQKKNQGRKSSEELNKFIDTYDTLSVRDFILSQIQSQNLANEIINQIQTLQCMSGDKLSMMQLFDDDSSLQLIKYYTGKAENTIDGMRVQNGMITLPQHMCNKMIKQAKLKKPQLKDEQIICMNCPVVKIENHENKNIKIYINGSNKVYVCQYIFFSVPIAVINQIEITNISQSKKIIFQNQQSGTVTRVYFVFQQAFWRYKYNGYGSFSHKFPFNELTELSPANLACGVLAFIFVADKYQKWIQSTPDPQKRIQYLKSVIADLFLKGDINSPHLKTCFNYTRSFSDNPYIRAGYQATTKRQIWKRIKDKGQDYGESYDRDENNLYYIGSEFADEFSTFMQGAIRLARQKVYKLLNMPDPWRN